MAAMQVEIMPGNADFLKEASELQSKVWSHIRNGVTVLSSKLDCMMEERDKLKDTIILLNMEKKDLYDKICAQALEIDLLKRQAKVRSTPVPSSVEETPSFCHNSNHETISKPPRTQHAVVTNQVIILDDIKTEEPSPVEENVMNSTDYACEDSEDSSYFNRNEYQGKEISEPETSKHSVSEQQETVVVVTHSIGPEETYNTFESNIATSYSQWHSSNQLTRPRQLNYRVNCTYCNAVFKTVRALNGHLRTHTGEKPFKCPHCNVSFADPSNLRRHVQIHTGVRPYTCSACGRTFKRKENLKTHQFSKKCFKS